MNSQNIVLNVMLTAVLFVTASPKLSEGTPQFESTSLPTLALSPGGAADTVIYENDSVFTIQGIRQELENDGEWINVTPDEIDPNGVTEENSGFDDELNTEYVWRPYNVEPNWSPYTNGYWQHSNQGWMWISNYNWGWRPYHYGRWWFSDRYGWVWSPGYVFAPSWVTWMYNDDYVGWYPISPRVRCRDYYDNYYYACHKMRYRTRCWTFVERRRFCDPITPQICVDPIYVPPLTKRCKYNGEVVISHDRVVNNGPDVGIVERTIGRKVHTEDAAGYSSSRQEKYFSKVRETVDKNNNNVSYNDKRDNNTKRNNDNGGSKQNQRNYKKDDTRKNDTRKNDNSTRNNDVKKNSDTKSEQKQEYKAPEQKREQKQENQRENKQEYRAPKKETKRSDDNNRKNDTQKNDEPVKHEKKQQQRQEQKHEKQESPKHEQRNDAPSKENNQKRESPEKNDGGNRNNSGKGNGKQ
jgi:hypothetical protein